MTNMHRVRLLLRLAACLVVLGAVAALTGSTVGTPRARGAAVRPEPTRPAGATPAQPSSWQEIDRLVSEQKLAEALEKVDAILAAARSRKSEEEWTKALIRSVQLRTALHGYETAVRFLKDQPWPQGELSRAALDLFYAQSLVTYARAYSWEIAQRETVVSDARVDLKAWSRDRIVGEAERAYLDVWKQRDGLGKLP